MMRLTEMKCIVPRAGTLKATSEEIAEYQKEVPEWKIIEVEGVQRLQRVFKFKNFVQALAFTNQVGELAEAEDHHPAILTEWGRVTLTWWTHKIKGLHRNDFITAAKSDLLYQGR